MGVIVGEQGSRSQYKLQAEALVIPFFKGVEICFLTKLFHRGVLACKLGFLIQFCL